MPAERVPADREVILRFVEYLRARGQPRLSVDSWPEDEHPGQSAVDAIAGPLAIEHTSIDTLPGQRTIGNHFQTALGPLEELPVSARLQITVPYGLVTVNSDWNAYYRALADWALIAAPALPDGRHIIPMPGTDLVCSATKRSDWKPKVVLYRDTPEDSTLSQRVSKQITRKLTKLRDSKAEGYTTVLLLETEDGVLMAQHKMLEAVREAVGGRMPEGLDQIWFAEAGGHSCFDFTGPVLRGDDIID